MNHILDGDLVLGWAILFIMTTVLTASYSLSWWWDSILVSEVKESIILGLNFRPQLL